MKNLLISGLMLAGLLFANMAGAASVTLHKNNDPYFPKTGLDGLKECSATFAACDKSATGNMVCIDLGTVGVNQARASGIDPTTQMDAEKFPSHEAKIQVTLGGDPKSCPISGKSYCYQRTENFNYEQHLGIEKDRRGYNNGICN